MKDMFEKNIKESFENFEYDYNPKAWDNLQSKLNSGPKGGKSPFKWYIAATVATGLLVAGYFILQPKQTVVENNTAPVNENSVVADHTEVRVQNDKTPKNSESITNNTVNQGQAHNDTYISNTQPTSAGATTNTTAGGTEDQAAGNNVTVHSAGTNTGGSTQKPSDRGTDNGMHSTNEPAPFITPEINDLCSNTSVKINNVNTVALTVIYPNGQTWVGKAKSNTTLFASVPGNYKVGFMEGETFIETGTFTVFAAPRADFDFIESDKPFEFGLPTTKVSTGSIGEQFTWSTPNGDASGRTAVFHLFNDGNQTISLTVTDANGCKSTVSKSIDIDNKYNLLAESGFEPTDINPVNNTFMPDALVERNVNFHMVVIDPKDGHTLFETTDASHGWDGIDKQTGQLVEFQKAYIWKVTLMNPLPGEKAVYSGTIVPVERKN